MTEQEIKWFDELHEDRTRVAEVMLASNKLIFKHNSNVRFTISDPKISPEEARSKGIYGHINSITSIGFSTKSEKS